jgi:prepilin-type N-terminal cleavage/methylation domain-containing protein
MFIKRWNKLRETIFTGHEKGFTLVEAVIAIALIGIVASGLYVSMGTSTKVLLNNDSRETAKNLAESQMEYVKGLDFNAGSGIYVYYPPGVTLNGYTIVTDAEPVPVTPTLQTSRDGFIQQVMVTITGPKGITYSLTDYKVK